MIANILDQSEYIQVSFKQTATNIIVSRFPPGDLRTAALSAVGTTATLLGATFNAARLAMQLGAGASFKADMAPVSNSLSAIGLGVNLTADVMKVADAIDAGNMTEANDALGRIVVGMAFAEISYACALCYFPGLATIGTVAIGYTLGRLVYDHWDTIETAFSNLASFAEDLGHSVFHLSSPLQQLLHDPLILDLDGDGIEVSGLNGSAVHFDYGGDGFAERTGWVSADDGLLAIDDNGNGRVDGAAELFGSPTQDGFAVLETLDSNHDGRIDAQDAQFAKLRVWRDLNQNGVSDAGISYAGFGMAERCRAQGVARLLGRKSL